MKLFYRVYGEGVPLIILHGLYGSSDNWIHIAKELQNECMVILPDMRNHGNSPWSDAHNYAELSRDVSDLMSDLGLPGAFIAGHSMGGKTATMFATQNPDKVYGLFIGDISPFAYEEQTEIYEQHRKILDIMGSVDPSEFRSRKELEDYLTTLAGEKTTRLVFSKNISKEKDGMRWKLNVKALSENLPGFSDGIAIDGKTFHFPVVVFRGSRSQYLSEEDLNKIKNVFPDVSIKTGEQCGHWIQMDCPGEVISSLKELLLQGKLRQDSFI